MQYVNSTLIALNGRLAPVCAAVFGASAKHAGLPAVHAQASAINRFVASGIGKSGYRAGAAALAFGMDTQNASFAGAALAVETSFNNGNPLPCQQGKTWKQYRMHPGSPPRSRPNVRD